MARARNIKPGFFTNEALVELPFGTRLLFIGLWTLADRRGVLEDRPKKIKMALFPADDINVEQAISDLQASGFIMRYKVGDLSLIKVLQFEKHQNPHRDERASNLPDYDKCATSTVQAQCEHGAGTVPARLVTDSLQSDSLQPDTPKAPSGGQPAAKAAKRAALKGMAPEVVDLFEQEFWPRYPRKEAKPKALEAFAKALPKATDGCRQILEGLERARRSEQWARDGGKYIPHAATWLNQERWNDEFQPAVGPARSTMHTGLRTGNDNEPLRGHDGSDLLGE